MDWKIFLATFGAVFVAELADKTQLVGITMASQSGRPFAVWAGSVSAYVLITAVSVVLGSILARYVKPDILKVSGGVIFVALGMLMLFKKI